VKKPKIEELPGRINISMYLCIPSVTREFPAGKYLKGLAATG
jgi:hypothetical protein